MEEQAQSEQSLFPSNTWRKVIKFFANNVLLVLMLTAAFYYLVERKEIEPRYAVGEPEPFPGQTTDATKLTLVRDGVEVENVYSVRIAIWNAGREYLDKEAISVTDPVKVVYSPETQILSSDFIRTSRDTLRLRAINLAEQGENAIQIQIDGDDVLYQGDGGILKIFYASETTVDFTVSGRVKGSPKGFVRVYRVLDERPFPRRAKDTVMALLVLAVVPFAAILPLVTRYKAFKSGRYSRQLLLFRFFFTVAILVIVTLLFAPLLWVLLGLPIWTWIG